jgi:hypothetical protein
MGPKRLRAFERRRVYGTCGFAHLLNHLGIDDLLFKKVLRHRLTSRPPGGDHHWTSSEDRRLNLQVASLCSLPIKLRKNQPNPVFMTACDL